MDINEILKKVEAGLSGDINKDMTYLDSQLKKYGGDDTLEFDEKKQVLKGIGKMMFKVSPDKASDYAIKSENSIRAHYKQIIDGAIALTQARDAKGVIKLLGPEIAEFEKRDMYKNEDGKLFYCLNRPMERVLYNFLFKNMKDVKVPVEPLPDLYFLYGVAKKIVGDTEESLHAMEQALRWNPVAAGIRLEYADYKYENDKDVESYMEQVEEAFKVAYLPTDVARCYAGFGKFFFEKGRMEIAVACMQLSNALSKGNPFAVILFNQLAETVEKEMLDPMSVEQIHNLLQKANLPTGPNQDVIGLAYTHGLKQLEAGHKDLAVYFLGIVYNTTLDKEVKEKLDEANAL